VGQKRRFDRRPVTSGLPRLTDILGVSRHVSNVPSTDTRAALRDFAAVPSIELNNCGRTQKKALHCAGPFSISATC
jgi:hypothetical protein